MAAPLGAFVLRAPIVTVGGTPYANQFTKARLVPDTPTQMLRTLVPDGIVQDNDTTAWTLELSGISDWKNGQGIADFLNDNTGLPVVVVLQPKPGTGEKTATFSIIAKPVSFGGEQGAWALFEETFGVVGQPVFSEAV